MWICNKCRKSWNYPVDRCIFCREKTQKIMPKQFMVRGMTQIFVPSKEHEKFPYYNLLLEDEYGTFHIKKTFKKYEIGQIIRTEIFAGGKTVAVCSIDYSVQDATKRAIELIGGININPNDRILIKPNIVVAKSPATGIVTNPLVVEGIIQYLLEKGVVKNNILIAEGSLQMVNSEKAVKKAGYQELCEKYGIEFKDLFAGEFVERKMNNDEGKIVQVSEEVFKADLIINVPVVKTHFQTGVSLGIKNMKGVINHPSRKIMHRGKLQEQIAYLSTILPKYITIADGSIGLEGMGPGALGTPANLGLIFAGKDPVAVDTVICHITNLEVAEHIKQAGELGLGESDLNKINIVGEETEVIQKKLQPADSRISPHPDIDLIDGKPCSGCLNSVWPTLANLKDIPAEEISVAFGSQIPEDIGGHGKIVAIGDCAIKSLRERGFEVECLPGCPPSEEQQREFLQKWLKK